MAICLCGTEFDEVVRGQIKQYCSDRCRQRAKRGRDTVQKAVTLPVTHEAIRLYCGIGETAFNHHPVVCGPFACVSPVSGRGDGEEITESSRRNSVYVPYGVQVIADSGAFSDGPKHRLSYADALARQIDHARQYKYEHQVTHRASYDLLIDETWQNEFRHKERWSEDAGTFAVKATVEAAAFLDAHRTPGIGCIMSAQGVTPAQYLDCTEKVLSYLDKDQDIFGLGGWCILGKQKKLLSVFRETLGLVIPLLGAAQVKRVHIWGVCFAEPLGELLWWCDQYGIALSTDSIGPSTRPVNGEWGYGSWRSSAYKRPAILDTCKSMSVSGYKAPTCSPDAPCRGLERARHVQLTREWLSNFREREAHLYHGRTIDQNVQEGLWEEAAV